MQNMPDRDYFYRFSITIFSPVRFLRSVENKEEFIWKEVYQNNLFLKVYCACQRERPSCRT